MKFRAALPTAVSLPAIGIVANHALRLRCYRRAVHPLPLPMKQRERQPDEHESRAAVAATVVWMLTCMSTAVAMLVVLALRLVMLAFPVAAAGMHPLARMADMFLFLAIVTGTLCLVLTIVVHRVRQIAPPRAITIGALLIGFAPIVALMVLTVLHS